MNWLKEKEGWRDLIDSSANYFRRNPLMIEKDLIQSFFLFEVSKSNLPFAFKGGTSLSKAFGVIDRFSEDIDLSFSESATDSKKTKANKLMLSIGSYMGLQIQNIESVFSRHNYNKYIFSYSSLYTKNAQEIIIETNFFQKSYPCRSKDVSSFVGVYAAKNHINSRLPSFVNGFPMSVQTLERTLIDKVFAVCDYRIENMKFRDSRHLYDIAKILPKVKTDYKLKELIKEVRADRMKSKHNLSANPECNVTHMLEDIIKTRFYESDYNRITKRLLHEDYSYDKAITNGIEMLVKRRLFDY